MPTDASTTNATRPSGTVDGQSAYSSLVIAVSWLLAVSLAAWQAWSYRRTIFPDDVSYLDMALGIQRGDWSAALNGLWSPLYPILLGLVFRVVNPSPYWELAVAHLVNLAIFILALGAYHFLLREILGFRESYRGETDTTYALPSAYVWALGYALFMWVGFELLGLHLMRPDWLLGFFVLMAIRMSLKIACDPLPWWRYALLGLILGLAFLAKAPAVPFSIAVLLLLGIAVGRVFTYLPRAALTIGLIALIASPYVAALSHKVGHFTIGESSRINYAWHINRVSPKMHWNAVDDARSEGPSPRSRKVLSDPDVYEFDAPHRSSYSPWYDPSYWNQGMKPHFSIRDHITVAVPNVVGGFYGIVYKPGFILLTVLALGLGICSGSVRHVIPGRVLSLTVVLPPVVLMGMFCAIHLESRYVAVYLIIFWTGLLASLRMPLQVVQHCYPKALLSTVLILLYISIFAVSVRGVWRVYKAHAWAGGGTFPAWTIASELHGLGLKEGDPVGSISRGFTAAYWAHLGRLRIIAELPPDLGFGGEDDSAWKVPHMLDRRVIDAFRNTGVKAIVAYLNLNTKEGTPEMFSEFGWRRLPGTHHFVYLFDETDAEEASPRTSPATTGSSTRPAGD